MREGVRALMPHSCSPLSLVTQWPPQTVSKACSGYLSIFKARLKPKEDSERPEGGREGGREGGEGGREGGGMSPGPTPIQTPFPLSVPPSLPPSPLSSPTRLQGVHATCKQKLLLESSAELEEDEGAAPLRQARF